MNQEYETETEKTISKRCNRRQRCRICIWNRWWIWDL